MEKSRWNHLNTLADVADPNHHGLGLSPHLYHRDKENHESLTNTVMVLHVVWTLGWSLQIKRDVSLRWDQTWERYFHYSLFNL